MSIHVDAVQASLQVKVDNSGTPASGDYVDLWIKWSPDATEYDTDEHAMFWAGWTRLQQMTPVKILQPVLSP